MAVPASQNLEITRGDTETVVVNLTNDAGAALNITGRTYSAQIRSSPNAPSVKGTFVCTVTNAAAGQVTCVLSATECATLSPGSYYWDFQENASGVISTLLAGSVTVRADVTR